MIYDTNTVELQSLNALPGDADGDTDVDITDINILATNFGADPAEWTQGNFDDTDVDITDIGILAANFGDYDPGSGASGVPEPAAMLLFALGLFGLIGWRRRDFALN